MGLRIQLYCRLCTWPFATLRMRQVVQPLVDALWRRMVDDADQQPPEAADLLASILQDYRPGLLRTLIWSGKALVHRACVHLLVHPLL